MIYLIGGPPRTGKTRLAQQLSRQLGIGWFPLDTLRYVVRSLVPEVTEMANFGQPPGPWADFFHPYVRDAVLSSDYVAGDYIIEGIDFMPRHAHALAAEVAVRSCFLGLSTADMATIDAHAGRMDYQQHLDPETRSAYPRWIERWTHDVHTECARLDLPFVDLAHDYEPQAAKALAILTEPSPAPQSPRA
jgi:hypothetical protein